MSESLALVARTLPTGLQSVLELNDAIFDALPVGAYACDAEGRIVRVNRKACELWGRTPRLDDDSEKFCGSFRLFTLDGLPIPREQTPMAKAVREGFECNAVEALVQNPDGRKWVGSVNIVALRDERGRVIGALNCFQDVTASYELRAAAERDRSFLRAVVDATPECVKVVAEDGTLLDMNEAGLHMVGAAALDDVKGRSTFDLIAPEYREQWVDNHRRVCAGGKLNWDFEIVALDGTRRHMETHGVPLVLADGSVAQLAVTRDVTDRRGAETALRAAEARHRQILESLPVPVYTTDAEGRLDFYNRAAVEFAGREPRVGEDSWCVSWKLFTLDNQALPHSECPFAISLKEGRPRLGIDEAFAETPAGERRRFVPFAMPLRGEDGRVAGGLNMLVDVTQIRAAESALARRAREQEALYRFTDRLLRAGTGEEVYEAALDAIAQALDCDRASILLADGDGIMRFVAWRGLSDDYRRAVEGHSPWKPAERDPTPVWVTDIEQTAEPDAIKQVLLTEGIRGVGFIPLLVGGRLAGKFMVYYRTSHEFIEEEKGVAVTIARQLGFTIEQRRADARRAEAEDMLRDREQRLASMFQNAGVGMVLMRGDCEIVSANPEFCRISGRSLDELVGSSCLNFTHPDDVERNRAAAVELSRSQGGISFEKRYLLPDERDAWVRINLNRIGDDQVLAVVEDIDASRRAEHQRQQLLEERARTDRMLREQAEEFHALADNIPTLCWMAYADGHIYWYNRRWYEYTGTSAADQEGWGWQSVHDPEVLPQVVERWKHSIDTGEPFEMTFPMRGADGEFRPFLTRVVPIRDEGGVIRRWFGTNTDVTLQARQQERLQLLLNELNHRVKNTLATVQSMALRSLRNAPTVASGLSAFEGRLLALSRAHNLLTATNWEGADLQELVTSALEPFASPDGIRVAVSGPSIWLCQRAAISLSMVLHELATNATKYGALAHESARLSIRWSARKSASAPQLQFDWLEQGLAGVQPPHHRGFGSQLIERTVRSELRGDLDLAYRATGLACRLEIPLDLICPAQQNGRRAASA